MRIRYEFIMWYQQLIKFIPGKLGCFSRNLLLPYKNGDNVLIWDGTHIDSPAKLIIGNNVSIGPNCCIYDHDHDFSNKDLLIQKQGYNSKEIFIGNNVWIASNVFIGKGVKISNGAIVASGSVVVNDVEENTVVGGVPAKFIKNRF